MSCRAQLAQAEESSNVFWERQANLLQTQPEVQETDETQQNTANKAHVPLIAIAFHSPRAACQALLSQL